MIMGIDILDESNFLDYALSYYENPNCVDFDEFHEDLNRIKYIKRLFNRFDQKNNLKERLILNHIIILNNVFGAEACSRILFFRIEERYHSYLKSFLKYLQLLPIELPEVDLINIPTNHVIDSILGKLLE
jgi:hypothetical protein|tara:strand:+ start:769 stop:1158 length:390 start_codon:yes stop_codon:yes gene_type:complete